MTTDGHPITIDSYIGGGGQGDVYKVIYKGEYKALKWYFPEKIKDKLAFYENLRKNTEKPSPDDAFLWPQAITQKTEGSFGYVMDLSPEGYTEMNKILFDLDAPKFRTFKAVAEACMRIASAFRNLHKFGYSYQDMNSGNFLINTVTGDVRICDNDNVAPNGTHTGIVGTPQYMAPEVVTGAAMPNTHTDEFSLAIVLFMLLCANHPLEGKHWMTTCLTPAKEKKLYGTEALFIFDPGNKDNRPVKGVHNNVLKRWDYMPQYIRDTFIRAFSQEAIRNPERRVDDLEWLKVLMRFQSDIVRCPHCGNEIFISDTSDTKCDNCSKKYHVANTMKLYEYTVTVARNNRVYRCQMGLCNADEALTLIGRIIAKDNEPDMLGFKNMTNDVITGITPSGKIKKVMPGEVIPVKAGITIKAYGGSITIE